MSSGLGRDEGRVIGNLYVGKMVERNVTWIIVLVLVVLSIRLARSSRLIRASRASRVNLLVNFLVRLAQNSGRSGLVERYNFGLRSRHGRFDNIGDIRDDCFVVPRYLLDLGFFSRFGFDLFVDGRKSGSAMSGVNVGSSLVNVTERIDNGILWVPQFLNTLTRLCCSHQNADDLPWVVHRLLLHLGSDWWYLYRRVDHIDECRQLSDHGHGYRVQVFARRLDAIETRGRCRIRVRRLTSWIRLMRLMRLILVSCRTYTRFGDGSRFPRWSPRRFRNRPSHCLLGFVGVRVGRVCVDRSWFLDQDRCFRFASVRFSRLGCWGCGFDLGFCECWHVCRLWSFCRHCIHRTRRIYRIHRIHRW